MNWTFKGIGTAEVDKQKIKCDFSLSSEEFFEKFSDQAATLSGDAQDTIVRAIDKKTQEKIKRGQDEIILFFSKVDMALKANAAPARTVSEEEEEVTAPKSRTVPEEEAEAAPVKTASRGSRAGEAKGELIPINVVETIVAKYPYSFAVAKKSEEDTEKKETYSAEDGYGVLTRDGQLTIKNISSDQRIWDISGKIANNGAIEDIDETLYVKELNAGEEKTITYKLRADKEPSIKVDELISTTNDPNQLTYSLNMDQDNKVYFKASLKNTESYTIKNVVFKKKLFEGYSDVSVIANSAGEWTKDEDSLMWKIPEMTASSTSTIEFTITTHISDKDQKIRSGAIEITYDAESSLSELKIDNFEAYGNNRISISDEQEDDKPDLYRGYLKFENLSNYQSELKKISVKLQNKDDELVQIPDETVLIGAGDSWTSNTWEVDTQGNIPAYVKEANYILLMNVVATTASSVQIEDMELAVAIFEASITYDVKEIASYREVPFNATHKLANAGEQVFDYVTIKHTVPVHFRPPKKEDMKLSVDGQEYDLKPEWITVSPDDDDPTKEHEIFVELKDLRNEEMGQFKPGQSIGLVYPMTAVNLAQDEQLITNAEWTANTYPPGKPLIIREEEKAEKTVISVIHSRLKVMRGKSVLATSDPSVHEIVLHCVNNGKYDITNYIVKDRIPDNYSATDFSLEPQEEREEHDHKEVIVWNIDKIAAGDSFEIHYKLSQQSEEARAKHAQFSM